MTRALFALALLVCLPAGSHAQQVRDCSQEPYRRFDFWVGEWDVTNAQGAAAGSNTISRIHADCALLEEWESASPHRGSSLNYYDAATDRWYQAWVDNGGNPLRLEGNLDAGGSMVLESAPGSSPRQRITWTPNEDGSVRQHWQISTDGGATWTTAFDGRYVRKGAQPAAE